MNNSTLSKKILYNTNILVAMGVLLLTALWFYYIVDDYNKDIKYLRQSHITEQKKIVEHSVKLLVKLISEKKIFEKDEIVKYVSKLRYGEYGYFWINDFTPTIIMHPIITSLDGKYVGDYKDPNGKFLFNEMVEVCKIKGEGFVNYHWPIPGSRVVKEKISFVKSIDELNWIVGSGIYLDEVENSIAVKKEKLRDDIITLILISVLISLALIILIYLFVTRFYKEVKGSFDQFYTFTKHSFETSDILDEKEFKYSEFKKLAKSTNNMVKQRLEFEKEITEFNENLENLVHERTLKLEENYKTLQETQSQLIQSEKMASLGGMVAGVAHEINTPVGIALTGITHIQDELNNLDKIYKEKSMSEKDFQSYIEDTHEINSSVIKNLKRAADLVKSFKQVAVDQSSDELRDFNLYEYMYEILSSLQNKIKRTKHKIEVDIDKDINLYSYPGAISQIYTNFILNSLIHAYEKDEVGNIKISAKLENKILTLTYDDDGKGLDEISKEKIFDPFYTTNRSQGGSGLGMNIVYNLVTKKLNGTIDLLEKNSKGISFIIKLNI
ncbi:cache domain-containing protein [Sulfurimonas sp.]|uniref:cache domain-containing protein n=1 Tax=Sulfurimonas sp. TaxID=2022749 RepID=UPI00356B1836